VKKISWSTYSEIFGRDQAKAGDQMIVNEELYTISSVDQAGVTFEVLSEDDEEE
jgi:hypothetical protein